MEEIKGVKKIVIISLIIGLIICLLGAVVWYVKTEDGIWRDNERGNPSNYTGSSSIDETEGIIIERGRIVEQALLDLLYEYGDIQQLTEQDIIRILDMSNKLGRNITSLANCTDAEILWCTSQEYPDHLETPEDLEKLLNAELVTQYPRLDNLPEDKLNGVIQFERHETDPDTGVSSTWMLEFIEEDDFDELFDEYEENGNRDVLKYFTLDDEENVIIATWEREEGDYSSNNTALQTDRKKIRAGMTEDKIKQEVDNRYEVTNYTSEDISAEYVTYTVKKQPIYYKNLVQQYTMPFEYLWSLLVMGESDDFVLKLADNVHETKITIGIFDNIDKAVSTNIERYTEEFKDRTETYEKNEGESDYTIVAEDPRHGSVAHASIDSSPDEEWHCEEYDYVHTEIVTTYQDIPQIQVIYADTWIVEVTVQFEVAIDTEEIYNETENLGSEPWDDSDCYTDTKSETRHHPDRVDTRTLEVIEGEPYTVNIKTEYYKYKHTIDKSKQSKLDLTTSKYQVLPAEVREKTEIKLDDEVNFIELLRGDSTAFTYLTNPTGIEWLAYVLSSNHYTTTFVDLTRYLLNKAKFPDDPSLSFDFSIFEPTQLSSMSITGITGGSLQEKVWFALKNLGYSDIVVAGAMGNIDYESGGFNPAAVEGGSGAGIGLIQWTSDRRTRLEKYASDKGVPWQDEDTQIEYLIGEISGQGRAVGPEYAHQRRAGKIIEEGVVSTHDDWANSGTIDDATLHFMRFFESPRSKSSLGERQERARRYYDEFSGRTGPLSGGSESIVASAVEVHRYIRENGYRYAQRGVTVPNYNTKTIDCSSYVTWVLVNAGVPGFTEGMYQKTSSVFNANPWGFAEVSVNEAAPGDIVVYSGHVEIVAYNNPGSNKFKVYNCGGSSSITATGTPDLPEASTSGYSKGSVVKILRVN